MGSKKEAAALLTTLDDAIDICVIWKPPQSCPVLVNYVKANDINLTPLNPHDPDSPRVFRLPPAMVGTKVTLRWFVAPTTTANQKLDSIGIAQTTHGSDDPTLIKWTDDPNVCDRGGVWQDSADVQF